VARSHILPYGGRWEDPGRLQHCSKVVATTSANQLLDHMHVCTPIAARSASGESQSAKPTGRAKLEKLVDGPHRAGHYSFVMVRRDPCGDNFGGVFLPHQGCSLPTLRHTARGRMKRLMRVTFSLRNNGASRRMAGDEVPLPTRAVGYRRWCYAIGKPWSNSANMPNKYKTGLEPKKGVQWLART